MDPQLYSIGLYVCMLVLYCFESVFLVWFDSFFETGSCHVAVFWPQTCQPSAPISKFWDYKCAPICPAKESILVIFFKEEVDLVGHCVTWMAEYSSFLSELLLEYDIYRKECRTYIYIYVYTHIYIHTHTYTNTHIYIYTHTHIYIYTIWELWQLIPV
jgi:hypothetical protein